MIQSASDKYCPCLTLNSFKKTSILYLTSFNLLSFNLAKFVFMSFHRKSNSTYNVNGHTIIESSSCKDLGIVFTNSLTWQDHYEMISSKAYKSHGLLCRVFKDSECAQAHKSLYITLVRSKLLYCSTLWRPYLLKDIESLEKIQQRATKFLKSNYHSDCRSRLIQCGILPLTYTYKIA